ncbi:TIGR04197 family type VII secretion effector [Butyrivibrio sp. AE2005]|uniref:TIGR04197 family type VII secretion effector n=1 Tax=Butyrivibrio sp. AE2005 TaxID=1496722 RepID=UPI00047C9CDC|nr:TIGR04197 family type VII secretion effector [Butyrivibrio sp. AE2005]
MAGQSTEIKIDYEELENFRKSVVTNGSYLGRDFNEGKKDVKSTIVANGKAHSAIDKEKDIRIKEQHMTNTESTNIAIMRKSFIDNEKLIQQSFTELFSSANVTSSNANGTTP